LFGLLVSVARSYGIWISLASVIYHKESDELIFGILCSGMYGISGVLLYQMWDTLCLGKDGGKFTGLPLGIGDMIVGVFGDV